MLLLRNESLPPRFMTRIHDSFSATRGASPPDYLRVVQRRRLVDDPRERRLVRRREVIEDGLLPHEVAEGRFHERGANEAEARHVNENRHTWVPSSRVHVLAAIVDGICAIDDIKDTWDWCSGVSLMHVSLAASS